MIFTVTLNPSLDRTLSVPKLHPGAIHRARLLREDLGGKGINVSRNLQTLGIPSRILGFAGGRNGEALRTGLFAKGFEASFVNIDAEIRQNITLLDESSGQYTKINELGPEISAQHIASLKELVVQSVQPGDLWALCGSLPPGAPPELYARLIQWVQARKGLAFLDTSGSALRSGLSARPFAIKINTEEAGELLGRRLEGDQAALEAARALQAQGIPLVVLTRGAQGLVLALGDGTVIAIPPPVPALSSVGAGDAALAGLLWGVSEQSDLITLSRRAVACGTAAAMQEGTGIGEVGLIQKLLAEVEIRPG
jgi:1-phosphofructokinase